VCKFYLVAACVMLSFAAACSRSTPNFIAVDPAKRSDTWALERADIDARRKVVAKGGVFDTEQTRSISPACNRKDSSKPRTDAAWLPPRKLTNATAPYAVRVECQSSAAETIWKIKQAWRQRA
jgi:hypothetical protein